MRNGLRCAMPAGKQGKSVHAHDQRDGLRAALGSHFLQCQHRVRRPGAAQFAIIHQKSRVTLDCRLDHREPGCGVCERASQWWLLLDGHKVLLHSQNG